MEDRRQDPPIVNSNQEAEYVARLDARRAALLRLEQWHARLAWSRLALVVGAALLLAVFGRAYAPWLVIPILAFIPLLFTHARVLNARDRTVRAVAFYQRGLARLRHQWQGSGARGERYRHAPHLYAEDLDLFGAGGLFELLVTARTRGGEDVLAAWLLQPSTPSEVRDRQEAVHELAGLLDLREDLAVLAPEVESTIRTDDLLTWAAAPAQLTQRWPRVVLPLVAGASTVLILQWIWSGQPPDLLLPVLGVQGLLALRFRHAAHHIAHGIEQREQELRALAMLLARVEQQAAQAPRLRALLEQIRATGRSPDAELRRLARSVDLLSSGHNLIFAPISALLMLGTQFAFVVEAWRRRCGPAVPQWLAALAEHEALCALATYRAEHANHPFPEFETEGPLMDADGLAHPLLGPEAVSNDVHLGEAHPRLLLVSGSNMSGKSTLLRTVGLNIVLAQAGAPVRATRMRLSPLRVGATLRIQDSLQGGQSRFFAEITRVSEIVSLTREVQAPWRVLFLLDELLSGTNSHDRLEGAAGILKGLLDHHAIGLATTHDLAVTALVDTLDGRARNVHFEDQFSEGTLTFDFRLKDGVVRTSNALALMRAVGLDV